MEKEDYNALTFRTDRIPVYNAMGQKEHEIFLPETITPLRSKRGGFSDSGLYYKGAGIRYRSHLVNDCRPETKLLSKTNIIYEKYAVCYPKLVGRFGIFQFPHQEVFSDREGGCGKKEMRLAENQKNFERSAIEEITDVIPTGIEDHNIFVYRLKKVKSEPLDIINLIEYVLQENYNTAWDKNLRSDIYSYSYIRDVADWFISEKLCHKLGTVYALLNAVYNEDVYWYSMLLKETLDTYNCEKILILYFSALLVNKYCPELFAVPEYDIHDVTPELMGNLFRLLFLGKACCHLENEAQWEWVREYYNARIENYVNVFKKRLIQMQFM